MLTTYRTKIRLLARIGAIIRPAKPLPYPEREESPLKRSEYSWGRSAPLPEPEYPTPLPQALLPL